MRSLAGGAFGLRRWKEVLHRRVAPDASGPARRTLWVGSPALKLLSLPVTSFASRIAGRCRVSRATDGNPSAPPPEPRRANRQARCGSALRRRRTSHVASLAKMAAPFFGRSRSDLSLAADFFRAALSASSVRRCATPEKPRPPIGNETLVRSMARTRNRYLDRSMQFRKSARAKRAIYNCQHRPVDIGSRRQMRHRGAVGGLDLRLLRVGAILDQPFSRDHDIAHRVLCAAENPSVKCGLRAVAKQHVAIAI